MPIPTLTEIYQTKKAEQVTKQQTSLLTAILELHESLRNINTNWSTGPATAVDQFRVKDLEVQLAQLAAENAELTQENTQLNTELEVCEKELDQYEQTEAQTESLKLELQFQLERFKTLQEHYKNSADFAKQVQDELKAVKLQLAAVNQTAPKGFKNWEDAAMTERLHHNETKNELDNAKAELATTKLKLERFQKLFKEALGQ